ncbi:MAG: NnrS family protein [Deltaproteobacteria bacterium]|nr:MAG: NnrS family protein [Deltaproteobacteria bacterium]
MRLQSEPHRLLFPIGALLAWAGVLPWLFFALGLKKLYAPILPVLVYRSFLHPLAELEGFLTCLAVGLLFTVIPRRTGTPPPALWQVVLAALLPIATAVCAAIEQWEVGQLFWLVLIAVVLEFTLRRTRGAGRPPSILWIPMGLAMGVCGAALAQLSLRRGDEWFWLHEVGRDLVMQGLFTGIALGVGRLLRAEEDEPATVSRPLAFALHALAGALFFASFFAPAPIGFGLRAAIALALVGPPRPPRAPDLARGLAQLSLWFVPLGNAWVAIAPSARRAGLHLIFLGCFATLLLAALGQLGRSARLGFATRQLGYAAGLLGLSLIGRILVELDPVNFHLWMGISAASFLGATIPWLKPTAQTSP